MKDGRRLPQCDGVTFLQREQIDKEKKKMEVVCLNNECLCMIWLEPRRGRIWFDFYSKILLRKPHS